MFINMRAMGHDVRRIISSFMQNFKIKENEVKINFCQDDICLV